jgi:hypothetical protein
MRWIITEPNGVKKALENASPGLLGFIEDAPPLSVTSRLDVYAEAYFLRLRDSLREDFCSITRIIGTKIFDGMISEYLASYPSRSHTITDVSEQFSKYLETHSLTESLPHLPDLARLEWLTTQQFYAADSAAVDFSAFSNRSPEMWAQARLVPAPSATLFHSDWAKAIHRLWLDREKRRGRAAVKPKAPGTLLIYRNLEGFVHVEHLNETQALILKLIFENKTLNAICERLAEQNLDETPRLMEWISSWAKSRILSQIQYDN